ncbi:hypothetical protein MTO96_008913 [Rhipicephalus appendiculatus]
MQRPAAVLVASGVATIPRLVASSVLQEGRDKPERSTADRPPGRRLAETLCSPSLEWNRWTQVESCKKSVLKDDACVDSCPAVRRRGPTGGHACLALRRRHVTEMSGRRPEAAEEAPYD